MYKESLDILSSINSKTLNEKTKVYYYHLQHSLYLLMEENSLSQNEKANYQYIILQYKDSLIKTLSLDDIVLATMRKGQLLSTGQYQKALYTLDSCLQINSNNESSRGILNYEISDVYEKMGDTEQQKRYLIMASICDLQRGVRSYIALRKLAILLFKENDIERANTYIQIAMEDAILCRARFRVLEISETLPIISAAYNKQKQEVKRTFFIFLILISILSVVLIISIICLLKQAKKRAATKKELDKMYEEVKVMNIELLSYNKQLSESNIIKEEYIRTVFYLCSTYIDKMEAYRSNMNRKLKAGKTQEVILITSQTNLVSSELKDFFQLFDAIFMKLYPNFIEDFNSHLLENEKIYCKNDDILAPELRVFALMKLGITDSSKVAIFLHYSPQTIYNYKLKVKNKLAISKEEFSRIMNLNW